VGAMGCAACHMAEIYRILYSRCGSSRAKCWLCVFTALLSAYNLTVFILGAIAGLVRAGAPNATLDLLPTLDSDPPNAVRRQTRPHQAVVLWTWRVHCQVSDQGLAHSASWKMRLYCQN
jgi:hypothetical protein